LLTPTRRFTATEAPDEPNRIRHEIVHFINGSPTVLCEG
jgi:hypothetical protein